MELLELFKNLLNISVAIAVLMFVLQKYMSKSDEQDHALADLNNKTIEMLQGVIQRNTEALQASEAVISRNTEALKELKSLIERTLLTK